jgi:NADH-quinone oxidoreductase subunit L
MKITAITMLIAALSLSGFPLVTSGFWSKDEILAAAFDRGQYLVLAVALITAFMTAFYMFRAWFLAFWGEPRWAADTRRHGDGGTGGHGAHGAVHSTHHSRVSTERSVHESPWVMTIPLIALAVPSVLSGFWGSPLAGNGFAAFLEGPHAQAAPLNQEVMGLSILMALGGIGLAWLMYGAKVLSPVRVAALFGPVYNVLVHKYWVDEIYNGFVRVVVLGLSEALRLFDVHVIDGAVNGVATVTRQAGAVLRRVQSGNVQSYGWAMYAGAVVIAVATLVMQFR